MPSVDSAVKDFTSNEEMALMTSRDLEPEIPESMELLSLSMLLCGEYNTPV